MYFCPLLQYYNPKAGYKNLNRRNIYRIPAAYSPVTAYTVTRPVLVNGANINEGLYPVLNYKPPEAQYPYIYVPAVEFQRVGAKVNWDESKLLLTITTDYYENKEIIEEQQAKINELQRELDKCKTSPPPQVPPAESQFKLTVAGVEGLTEEQRAEINNLIATRTPEEIERLYIDAFFNAYNLVTLRGGEFIFGTGAVGDGRGFRLSYFKGCTVRDLFNVFIHSNDPDYAINEGRYTYEQREDFSNYLNAMLYVVLRNSIENVS